jgi:hypothetical protein
MASCTICKRELDNPADPSTVDCGGDCRRCMAEAGDPDCIAAMAEIAREANPPLQCVAVYLEDRQYGGPEEGGWWYDAGELVTDAAFYVDNLITPPMAYADPDVAAGVEVALQLLLDAGPNVGRRPTSSMASTGRYVARVEDFPPPLRYPAETPHYE